MSRIFDAQPDTVVAQLYIAYLDRAPDPVGFQYWLEQYNEVLRENDGDTAAAFGDLSGRLEDAAVANGEFNPGGEDGGTAETTVSDVYQNILGREPDEKGLVYWSEKIETGTALADVIAQLIDAAVSQIYSRDAKYLNNRTEVAVAYAGVATSDATGPAKAILEGVDENPASVAEALAELGLQQRTELTTGRDVLIGTSGNDVFYAPIIDNQNTFQNGDIINGGRGEDTLYAEIGNSQKLAIGPQIINVENVVISARAVAQQGVNDGTDNNLGSGARAVQIDAGQSRGVDNWENNDSRADLIIEDVRLNFEDQTITKDITITFRDSDPGNVDYAVYFDQQSLIAADTITTNTIAVTIANPLEASKGFNPAEPLKDVPYDFLQFILDGEEVRVDLDLTDVVNYDQLDAALRTALADYPEITLTRIPNGAHFIARDGQARSSDLFTLSVKDGSITPATIGWGASGGLPSNNAFSAVVEQGLPDDVNPLITSTVVLDNVGRGSTGGDLVIGGLSAGNTSSSKGVQQFDITVEQSSKLQTISSTADTLEVVNLVNDGNKYNDVINGKVINQFGNLTVLGAVDVAGFGFDTAVGKVELPSDAADQDLVGAVDQNNGYGFTNVREINAGTFVGNLTISAVLTDDVVAKYLDVLDEAPNLSGDDNVEFNYTLGQGNDKLSLAISNANLALAGTATREDFELNIDGGAGDDIIEVAIYNDVGNNVENAIDNLADDSVGNWYANSKLNANLSIDAGAGNDTVYVYGSGDWKVDLATGNDTVYLADSGDADNKAVWVFNTIDQISANSNARDIDDLASGDNTVYTGSLFKSVLTVNFRGLTADIELGANVSSNREINQAIKQAINSDPVLSKLLLAIDGPSNTLIVASKIDGNVEVDDLTVGIALPNGTAESIYSAADIAAYATALNVPVNTVTAATILAAVTAQVAAFNAAANTDYDSALANDNGVNLAGADSIHSGDSVITVNQDGTDVIVLSTNSASAETVIITGALNPDNPVVIVNFDALNGDVVKYQDAQGNVVDTTFGLNGAVLVGNDIVAHVELALDNGSDPGPGPGPDTFNFFVNESATGTDGEVDFFVFNVSSDANGAFATFGELTIAGYNEADGDTILFIDGNNVWTSINDFIVGNISVGEPATIGFNNAPADPDQSLTIEGQAKTGFGNSLSDLQGVEFLGATADAVAAAGGVEAYIASLLA